MAVQQQQQLEQNFTPRFDREQTRKLIKAYEVNPGGLPLEDIRQHAAYHNVPFYEGDFSLYEAVKQIGGGFIEGFTTLKLVDPPDNEYEAIFRNVGHLAGFAPGIISGPAKAIGAVNLARAAALGNKISIPMAGANLITRQAKKLVKPLLEGSRGSRFSAVDDVSKHLLGNKARHITEGAFHLGTASAISSVWEGVDAMMQNFIGGAVAGGVFRGIGNVVGVNTKDIKFPINMGTEQGAKVAKAIAGSAFMGIPASMRGATTPEQVYEYLMGAYFGGKELPFYKAEAAKLFAKMNKQALKDSKIDVQRDPTKIEGYESLPEISKKEVVKMAEKEFGTPEERTGMSHMLMKKFGILDQIPKEELEAGNFDSGYPILRKVLGGRSIATGEQLTGLMAISGGDTGSQRYFSSQLKKAGGTAVNYVPTGRGRVLQEARVAGIPREMSNKELLDNVSMLEKAGLKLKKKVPSEEFVLNLQLRAGEIVKKSDKIFAVGDIINQDSKGKNASYAKRNPDLHNKVVGGGTSWGVQMAVNARKPVFVYDQKSSSWYTFNYRAPKGGLFIPVKGTPQMSERPGFLGTRFIASNGKKAIKQLISTRFPDAFKNIKPETEATIPGAVDPTKVEVNVKTAERLKRVIEKQESFEDARAKVLESLKDKNIDKARESELLKELKTLDKQLADAKQELDVLLDLKPTEYINRVTGEIIDEAEISIDVGMGMGDTSRKSVLFTRRFMKPHWDNAKTSKDKDILIEKVSEDIDAIITKNIDRTTKVNKAEEAALEIEKIYPGSLSSEAKGNLRSTLRGLNYGQPVRYLRVRGREVSLSNNENPMTYAGKRKKVFVPATVLEQVYKEAFTGKQKGTESSVAVFDEITVRDKGVSKDIPLGKYRQFLASKGIYGKRASKVINKSLQNVFNIMQTKHDMVPFGGIGDKGRITFVKLHPMSKRPNAYIQKKLTTIKKRLSEVDKNAYMLYNKSKKAFANKYGKSYLKKFDQMFYSNVLYDLALNGYSIKEGETSKSLKELFGKGYVPSAVAFNKRSQIWQNPFFPGDKQFFKGQGLGMNENGNFNYVLIEDPKTPYVNIKTGKQITANQYDKLSDASKKRYTEKATLKTLNQELPEHVDGAIITRTDVLDRINLDAGIPESGQNKSFIVSRGFQDKNKNPLGTLLGKYMMHDAGPDLSAQMKEKNLHYLIMTSAAKQTGTRKAGQYTITKDKKMYLKDTETYELDPSHISYSPSTYGQKKMLEPQVWVKQLFTSFHQYGHKKVSKDIIEDINQSVIQDNVKGTAEGNALLQQYSETLNDALIPKIMKNIRNIGTAELIEVSKQPGAERFSGTLLQHMLRVNTEAIKQAAREGEMTNNEAMESIQDLNDFVSSTDRILKIASVVSSKANSKGETGFPVFFHKYIRDYRLKVLHNWVADKVTRPKVDNSAVGFIRPYDKMLRVDKRFKELNKRDDIFYLDEAYRDMDIELAYTVGGKKRVKLGELWDKLQAGDFKDPFMKQYVKDVFEAIVLRVPMDSASGAHRLEFKGFTDRKGYGILMHGRTMRALGGADLDGDEAFIYFGGRTKENLGKGMKNSWKQAIHSQKEEFYDGNNIKDNKKAVIKVGPHKGKTYAEVLTQEGSGELKDSKTLYYSPEARIDVSLKAFSGRAILGGAASGSQIIRSAYSAIMDKPNKKDSFVIEFYDKKKKKKRNLTVTISPRQEEAWRKYQREMIRAQIAFGSDPLDEAGLKSANEFFKLLHEAHFRTFVTEKGKKTNISFKDLSANDLRNGTYGKFHNMNAANFSRNFKADRNWTFEERNKMNNSVYEFPSEELNTILPKMVKTLAGIDYSDRIFNRINRDSVKEMYAKMEEYAKTLDYLKGPMERSSFRVPYNKEVDVLFRNLGTKEEPAYLSEEYILRSIANSEYNKQGRAAFDAAIEGTEWGKRMKLKSNFYIYKDPEKKEIILREVVKNAEDFITNDFIDMASILNTVDIVKKNNLSKKTVSDLHAKAEDFKINSYMDAKRRREASTVEVPETETEKAYRDQFDLMQRIDDILYNKKIITKKRKLLTEEVSALKDQVQLDKEIASYKEMLTKGEKELFDNFMLGSLNRGNLNLIQKYYDKIPENFKDKVMTDLYRNVLRQATKTQLNRVGYNSKSVSNKAIEKQLTSLNDLFGKVWNKPSKSEESALLKEIDKAINKTEMDMADGTKEQGYVGTNYQVDRLLERAVNNEGYAGIKPSEVKAKDKALIAELAGNLKDLNEKVGANLGEVLGGITAELQGTPKDLNAFNRSDFELVNNYLKDLKTGNIFQRIFKSKTPELQRRHYWLFPEAVNRELMKDDILLLKKEGYFVTKDGNVSEKARTFRKPTYYIDVLMNQVNEMNSLATSKSNELIAKNAQELFFLEELPSKEKEGLFSIAVTQRELGLMSTIDSKKETIPELKRYYKQAYLNANSEAESKYKWKELRDKEFTVTNDKGERVRVTGWEIVNGNNEKSLTGIKGRLNKRFQALHKLIVGNRDYMYDKGYMLRGNNWDGAKGTQPKVFYKLFLRDVYKIQQEGNEKKLIELMENVGIDGLRHVARSMMVDMVPKQHRSKYKNFEIVDTNKFDFDKYWPHMFFSKRKAEQAMKTAISYINKSTKMNSKEKKAEIQKILYKHKSLTGEWEFQDMQRWDRVDQLSLNESLKEISKQEAAKVDKINFYNANQKTGSMMSRSSHIPGWDTSPHVLDAYVRNISNTFFRQMQQIMSRDAIENAYSRMKKKFGNELAWNWKRFLQLYAQGAMGNPEIIPEEMYNDPRMKLKGTPYAWWADNRVMNKINKIADNLGINKKDVPEELGKFTFKDIRDWSNLEARFELAALLAHPKSAITNLFGGTMHTAISAGFGNIKKARDIKFLKKIFPEFNSLQDAERWVISKGVLPEMVLYELGLNKQFQGKNTQEFLKELSTRYNSTNPIERQDLRSLANEYNVSSRLSDIAGKFMSVPERVLRRDSFLAHYIKAWERFGGAIKDPNHPFLIEMAKKGVKATQFLYDAPNRPMFARSAFGKVMSRFQLFAWNSVRFRNDIMKEAKLRGFKTSAETDRFMRLAQMDIMVYALGSMFMYSLFDNALPPPWNWWQDTANWLFGDEKEREKAFFGELPVEIAPLKMIMPPAARIPITGLQQFINDDYDKFTNLTIWTMFPFGRIARDVFQDGNGLIDNPTFFMEKFAGLPLHAIGRIKKKEKKLEEEGKRYVAPRPGIKF